ncbi:hypothetical protein ACTJIJ_19840 [Niabella sp. 22666]|uniref:hypothetical protein n=1 Tax=Niabella sp. 22666 TaxID=3453954 RepID=UPI003F85BB1C
MLEVIERPNAICWSGNPISYTLRSVAAASDNSIFFQIRIMFQRQDAGDYTLIHTFDHVPVAGFAYIDLQDILDSLLTYTMPIPGMEYHNSKTATGKFYIQYAEVTGSNPIPFWNTEFLFARTVIKGGIAYEKWRGGNYWSYYVSQKPFLTWQLSGKLTGRNEHCYLAWFNTLDIAPGDLEMHVTVTYFDSSTTTFSRSHPCTKGDVHFIPTGYNALNIASLSSNRVYTWAVKLLDAGSGNDVSETFVYELDNRADYNDICLSYRNSLGGLDSLMVRGIIEYNAERSFTNIETVAINNYYKDSAVLPRVKAINATEWIIKKGSVGHLRKEEADRLRDIHFQRECWQLLQSKWVPVVILSGGEKLNQSDDQRWSLNVTFAVASNGNRYYTPDNVELPDSSSNGCEAVSLEDYQIRDASNRYSYIDNAPIFGSAPFTLNIIEKPSWLDIVIGPIAGMNYLQLSSFETPPAGTYHVHLEIGNCAPAPLVLDQEFTITAFED